MWPELRQRTSRTRLPAAPAVAYGYDDAGNRTSAEGVTFSYDALNQLVSDSAGTDYSYDGAGRLVEVDESGPGSVAYSHDALDQLLEVDDGSSPITYGYDSLGRQSERTVTSTTETAHYGDLSDGPILDTGTSGVLRGWVYGAGRIRLHWSSVDRPGRAERKRVDAVSALRRSRRRDDGGRRERSGWNAPRVRSMGRPALRSELADGLARSVWSAQ